MPPPDDLQDTLAATPPTPNLQDMLATLPPRSPGHTCRPLPPSLGHLCHPFPPPPISRIHLPPLPPISRTHLPPSSPHLKDTLAAPSPPDLQDTLATPSPPPLISRTHLPPPYYAQEAQMKPGVMAPSKTDTSAFRVQQEHPESYPSFPFPSPPLAGQKPPSCRGWDGKNQT